jgi:hypothetical protein
MPRKRRIDGFWLLHHVCNRGIARRPVFETSRDVAFFLERLGRAGMGQGVDVLAYSVLTTHFHLLVRTTHGSLSRAMRSIEQAYVQYFNRTRGRDGPLFKDRFFSRPIRSETDFRLVVRYIDENAVVAGLAATSVEYPHGSARWYAQRTGPSWLARATIEKAVCGDLPYDPGRYLGTFGWTLSLGQRELVERRMRSGYRSPDSVEDLIDVSPERVRQWLAERARLADGGPRAEVLLSADSLLRQPALRDDDWIVRVGRVRRPAGPVAAAGMLRVACGCSFSEIAARLTRSVAETWRLVQIHRRVVRENPQYAERVAGLVHAVLRSEHGSLRRSRGEPRTADEDERRASRPTSGAPGE